MSVATVTLLLLGEEDQSGYICVFWWNRHHRTTFYCCRQKMSGDQLAGEWLWRKWPGDPGGEAEHVLIVCPCRNESYPHIGLWSIWLPQRGDREKWLWLYIWHWRGHIWSSVFSLGPKFKEKIDNLESICHFGEQPRWSGPDNRTYRKGCPIGMIPFEVHWKELKRAKM